jgi:hypothetical protein
MEGKVSGIKQECEGEFCTCREGLKEYSVINPETGYDWGIYTYCEEHRDVDIEAGFEVVEI